MAEQEQGANALLDEIFGKEDESETPADNQEQDAAPETGEQKPEDKKAETQAVAHRIKEVKAKTEQETRDAMAREDGYVDYADKLAKRAIELENKTKKEFEAKGYDPEDLKPLMEKYYEDKVKSDPRYQLLQKLENEANLAKANAELKEIQQLNPSIKSLDEIPKEVFELAKTTKSIKSAYMAIEGEKLLGQNKAKASAGTTEHMKAPASGVTPSDGMRPLTAEELSAYRYACPHLTEEQIKAIRKPISK